MGKQKFGWALIALSLLFAQNITASPWALYGSVLSGGSASGGVRFSLSDNICFDASLGSNIGKESGSDGANTDLYLDAFFFGQTIGIVGAGNFPKTGPPVTSLGLAYALEKSINPHVALGVSPTLVSKSFQKDTDTDVGVLTAWNLYAVIGF